MPTKITIDALSAESLEKAAQRVRKLQKTYVNRNREFVRQLTDVGIKVIYMNIWGLGDSEPPEPNEPHVNDYWYYTDDDGYMHQSYGTEATMPMWKADQEIRQKFASIAKQVFGSITGV